MTRGSFTHLVRRAFGAFSDAPPSHEGVEQAASVLSPAEFALWGSMQGRDRRHSLEVLARFDALVPAAPVPARAAALLHDVGKAGVALGWTGRILATVLGPRTDAFDRYLRHEEIGAEMLRGVSDPATVRLVTGEDPDDPIVVALRRADEI